MPEIEARSLARVREWCRRTARSLQWLGLAAVAGMCPASGAMAQSPARIEVIVFPGGFNWPIWVGQDKFFARYHIDVKVAATPSSAFQLAGLIEGKFDIAMTAIDNIIAYVEGQASVPAATRSPDLIAFMGGDNGFLHLITVPEVKTYADLKGRQLSVDALSTGYAFVLRKLLEKGGLEQADYALVSAGGVQQRFEALLEKKHAGTLLISPFEVAAEARGFNLLADASDALGHYQGLVGATRQSWAKQHESELIGFIRGYRAALDWLYDPANKTEAVAVLLKNLPGMPDALAQKSYDILLHPVRGFTRDASLDVDGIRTVLALRSEYLEPRKPLQDPQKYYDLSYELRARGP
jgi:ABC-type nitrate/sulfonate/bicarbonate transport system substrate-binding protein